MKLNRLSGFFSVILFIVALDQLSKAWIVCHIAQNEIGFSFFGGLFRLIHVRNLGAAFSVGNGLPDFLRVLFLILFPLLFLLYLGYLLFRDTPFLPKTRYLWLNHLALVFIIGGGLGNLLDRIFREGVVDFIDVEFFGLFGLDRWPAFNLADSSVFIGACFWLLASFLTGDGKKKSEEV